MNNPITQIKIVQRLSSESLEKFEQKINEELKKISRLPDIVGPPFGFPGTATGLYKSQEDVCYINYMIREPEVKSKESGV